VVANPAPGRLRGLPRLRLIQSLWAGVDRLLADPTLPVSVPLARMVDPAMNAAMAETALWATLSLHRDFFGYARQQREARWLPHPQRRADEVRVCVLGQGEMGRSVAERLLRQGYRVSGWSRRAGPLAPLLREADVLINLLPLTPETHGLLGAQAFAQMPRGAGLVNLARGAHVVDSELLAALDAGQIGHAVLDVFRNEPLPESHPYWRHPKVTVLPHAAAQTDPRSAARVVAANVHALLAGEPLAHLVDRSHGY
jgi:glyoxylate/hydroxypyruvate reductase A